MRQTGSLLLNGLTGGKFARMLLVPPLNHPSKGALLELLATLEELDELTTLEELDELTTLEDEPPVGV